MDYVVLRLVRFPMTFASEWLIDSAGVCCARVQLLQGSKLIQP